MRLRDDDRDPGRRDPRLHTVYQVAGMTCGGCASRVSKQLAEVPGVSDVSIDVATGAVTVTSSTKLDDAASTAVTQAG